MDDLMCGLDWCLCLKRGNADQAPSVPSDLYLYLLWFCHANDDNP